MTIREIKEQYIKGEIGKNETIDKMHALHQILFEYADYLKDSGISCIEITDQGVVMTARKTGMRMSVERADKRIIPVEILNFGSHEEEELDLISSFLQPGALVLDVGANVGWYTVNIALMDRDIEIHAFEPLPPTFEQLKSNMEMNHVKGVHLHNFGFWETAKDLPVYFDPSLSGAASAADILDKRVLPTVCAFSTLDLFRETLNRPVDFIKCDVEGGELFVVRGARKTIETDRPVVFMELLRKWAAKFDYHPNDVIRLFREMGYSCFEIVSNSLKPLTCMDDNTAATNFFFLHATHHQTLIDRLGGSSTGRQNLEKACPEKER